MVCHTFHCESKNTLVSWQSSFSEYLFHHQLKSSIADVMSYYGNYHGALDLVLVVLCQWLQFWLSEAVVFPDLATSFLLLMDESILLGSTFSVKFAHLQDLRSCTHSWINSLWVFFCFISFILYLTSLVSSQLFAIQCQRKTKLDSY